MRLRNRLTSQLTAPALSKIADVPNSAAPRPAKIQAVRALGTRAGRFGQYHDLSEIMAATQRAYRYGWPAAASNGGADFAARPLSVSTGLLFFLQPWLRLYFEIPIIGVDRHEEVVQEAF